MDNDWKASTVKSPLASAARRSIVSIVDPAITSGVILHRATTSPGSTGRPS